MRLVCLCVVVCTAAVCADPPLAPLSVCEVLRDLAAHEGQNIAVIGRYSYRGNGRWMGEQSCASAGGAAPAATDGTAQPQLWIVEDLKDAPKPPGNFELDAVVLNRKFAELQRHTTLGKFRFGTPDYDRWAVIFGRVEARKGDDAKKAPANLIIRGSGVIIVLTNQE